MFSIIWVRIRRNKVDVRRNLSIVCRRRTKAKRLTATSASINAKKEIRVHSYLANMPLIKPAYSIGSRIMTRVQSAESN